MPGQRGEMPDAPVTIRSSTHSHPGGEETLVLHGVFSNKSGDYEAGAWLCSPRSSRHTPFTGPQGALIFVKVGHLGAEFLVSWCTNALPAITQSRPGTPAVPAPATAEQALSFSLNAGMFHQPALVTKWNGVERRQVRSCARRSDWARPTPMRRWRALQVCRRPVSQAKWGNSV